MPPEQVILFIIGTVVILFGAYYVTYYVGMKASGQTRAGLRNRNINMLDRYAIARDKQFCIIEIAGKVYIIGATNHSMTLLDTIDAAEFAKLTENNKENITPWNMTPVGMYGNKLTKKVVAFVAEKLGKLPPDYDKSEEIQRENETDDENEIDDNGEGDFAESLKEAKRLADEISENSEPGQADMADEEKHGEKPEDPEDD